VPCGDGRQSLLGVFRYTRVTPSVMAEALGPDRAQASRRLFMGLPCSTPWSHLPTPAISRPTSWIAQARRRRSGPASSQSIGHRSPAPIQRLRSDDFCSPAKVRFFSRKSRPRKSDASNTAGDFGVIISALARNSASSPAKVGSQANVTPRTRIAVTLQHANHRNDLARGEFTMRRRASYKDQQCSPTCLKSAICR
jgi:hypothetical protein